MIHFLRLQESENDAIGLVAVCIDRGGQGYRQYWNSTTVRGWLLIDVIVEISLDIIVTFPQTSIFPTFNDGWAYVGGSSPNGQHQEHYS